MCVCVSRCVCVCVCVCTYFICVCGLFCVCVCVCGRTIIIPVIVKTKSHVEAIHLFHRQHPLMWIYANEVADVAADVSAGHLGDFENEVKDNKEARGIQASVCMR